MGSELASKHLWSRANALDIDSIRGTYESGGAVQAECVRLSWPFPATPSTALAFPCPAAPSPPFTADTGLSGNRNDRRTTDTAE